jgi:hypothetical protein
MPRRQARFVAFFAATVSSAVFVERFEVCSPSFLRTISAIQTGAYGGVQPGDAG